MVLVYLCSFPICSSFLYEAESNKSTDFFMRTSYASPLMQHYFLYRNIYIIFLFVYHCHGK